MIFNQVFGLPSTAGMISGALFVMVYSSLGGFLAASYTDVVQGCLMLASLIVVSVVAVVHAGGPAGIASAIREQNPDIGSVFAEVGLDLGEWATG
ncbi:sodium:solute symporter family transporter, partial [Escherichia coli]|uniref:sodium:solute symporter family transporter n=1 Tax=Escherichia coli TaxID=562 RepID=UPI003F79F337